MQSAIVIRLVVRNKVVVVDVAVPSRLAECHRTRGVDEKVLLIPAQPLRHYLEQVEAVQHRDILANS